MLIDPELWQLQLVPQLIICLPMYSKCLHLSKKGLLHLVLFLPTLRQRKYEIWKWQSERNSGLLKDYYLDPTRYSQVSLCIAIGNNTTRCKGIKAA